MKENNSTIEQLINYFQNQADTMDMGKETILTNRSDRGDHREHVIFDFMQRHLPERCTPIRGGFIFDHLGNCSRQIDIIVTNDSTLQFKSSSSDKYGKSFNCVEGCYAAISVKTRLDKSELVESLDNLSSIPLLNTIQPNPLINNFDKIIKHVPTKVIFAFEGDSVETMKRNINEYLNNHNYPPERLPDFIVVNKKYYIWKVGPNGIQDILNDMSFDYGSYVYEYNYDRVGAMALLHLITFIQKISNLSIASMINFDEYLNKAELYLKSPYIEKNRDGKS